MTTNPTPSGAFKNTEYVVDGEVCPLCGTLLILQRAKQDPELAMYIHECNSCPREALFIPPTVLQDQKTKTRLQLLLACGEGQFVTDLDRWQATNIERTRTCGLCKAELTRVSDFHWEHPKNECGLETKIFGCMAFPEHSRMGELGDEESRHDQKA